MYKNYYEAMVESSRYGWLEQISAIERLMQGESDGALMLVAACYWEGII